MKRSYKYPLSLHIPMRRRFLQGLTVGGIKPGLSSWLSPAKEGTTPGAVSGTVGVFSGIKFDLALA